MESARMIGIKYTQSWGLILGFESPNFESIKLVAFEMR